MHSSLNLKLIKYYFLWMYVGSYIISSLTLTDHIVFLLIDGLIKIDKIYENKYLTHFELSCRCIASFFSICSMGNWGTSYGADISFGRSLVRLSAA